LWYVVFEESFQGSCFGHAFSKACQYTIIEEKVCKKLQYVPTKVAQGDLQKCIMWPKKSRKGRQELEKACVTSNVPPRKLNTPMNTR
jgi:hypothetical protein